MCSSINKMYSRQDRKNVNALVCCNMGDRRHGRLQFHCLFGATFPPFPRQRRIRLVGGVCTDWAGTPLRHYTLQQSGRLPNKQMKSTERCFLVSSEMWLQQMQRWHRRLTQCDNLLCRHFDLFWRKRGGEGAGADTVHMITHKIMFVSSNRSVTV